MVEGKFLSADDFGPLGRLVAPGELLVLEQRDAARVWAERAWVNEKYTHADKMSGMLRRRLRTAHMGGNRDKVRDAFEDWTVEAAKLALCDQYLLTVAGQLDLGKRQAVDLPQSFRYRELPQVQDLVTRVLAASDEEIVSGQTYRAC